MSHHNFYEFSAMASLRMLIGVWRHDNTMCRPGFYRVIPCPNGWWDLDHFDAVVDDFGDLVAVNQ